MKIEQCTQYSKNWFALYIGLLISISKSVQAVGQEGEPFTEDTGSTGIMNTKKAVINKKNMNIDIKLDFFFI